MELKVYKLKTITYGVDCAPYQAIRTLHQVAEDVATDEIMENIITGSFYMDDLLHGANSITECQMQVAKVKDTLNSAKPLIKWSSNNEEVLKFIKSEDKITL